jgi:hypothetical protein
MGTAARNFVPEKGSIRRGVVHLYGRVTTSTSGTISTQTGAKKAGFTVAKTGSEAGRYTVTLLNPDGTAAYYQELLACDVTLIGATDAAYTTAKGINKMLRNDAVSTAGTFDIQLQRTDTAADAEVEDSAILLIRITLSYSSV